jgi:hypothetical protein
MSKRITIEITRRDRTSKVEGTIEYLVNYFGYTLESGASYQNEKGNSKVNTNPKSAKSLVSNLNTATNNCAANGYSTTSYSLVEVLSFNKKLT